MPTFAHASLSTGPLATEVRTDAVFKIPNADDKAIVTREMLGGLADYESLDMLQHSITAVYGNERAVNVRIPAVSHLSKISEGPLAIPVQTWEGTVISIDETKQLMLVKLSDRAGLISAHTCEIDLEWVVTQDLNLVKPGAVFYWTIYKETKRGSIKNSEEIQFRRLPSWTKKQVAQLYEDADAVLATFST